MRWIILFIPYDPQNCYNLGRFFYIGHAYRNYDTITWDEYNFEELKEIVSDWYDE